MEAKFSRSLPCANTEGSPRTGDSPCEKIAAKACSRCVLVQYCSRECQQAHWPVHKVDCNSPLMKTLWKPAWEVERRSPSFILEPGSDSNEEPCTFYEPQNYLWGNVPALDVLNLPQNEGIDTDRDLRLLFAASGDLRNVVKTVAGLPASYPGNCEITMNDRDADIVVRNLILHLVALKFEPTKAVPLMIHLWYSVLIPENALCQLRDNIAPLIQDVCSKIQEKPDDSLQAKTWIFGTVSLRLVVRKRLWDDALQFFQVPDGLSATEAQEIRKSVTLAPHRIDYLHRRLLYLPPTSRVGTMKFRTDGILLPLGSSRKEFDTPNPTFFRSKSFWPMKDSADPLHGWPFEDVLKMVPLAKNDVYGGLYFYLQGILSIFCQKLKSLKLSFSLFQVDVVDLANVLRKVNLAKQGYDRIEVANISDIAFLGPGPTLTHLSPLLRLKAENPHATIITLFLNAIYEIPTDKTELAVMIADMKKAAKYLPPFSMADLRSGQYPSPFIMIAEARTMFWDHESMFLSYMQIFGFDKIGWVSGTIVKEQNTIIDAWPIRLKKNHSQREFDLLRASGHIGSERYVEWKVGDVDPRMLEHLMSGTKIGARKG